MKTSRIKMLIRFVAKTVKQYKLQIIVLSVLGILSGFLEAVGINALIPMFSFVLKGEGAAAGDKISLAIKAMFAFLGLDFALKSILIFITLLFLTKAAVNMLCFYVKLRITSSNILRVRSDLFKKTLKANWSFLLNQKMGYLEQILVEDASVSASLLTTITNLVLLSANLLMYVLVALNISVLITLFAFMFGCFLFLFFKPLLYKTREFSKKITALNKEISHYINENVVGMKTIKAFSVEEPLSDKSYDYFSRFRGLQTRISLLSHIHPTFMELSTMAFILVMFAVSYSFDPNFNLPSLLVLIYLVQRIFAYFQSLQENLRELNEKAPRLQSALQHEENIKKHKEEFKKGLSFKFSEALRFQNVNFAYKKDKPVLSQLSFALKKGEMLGLVGPSGAGKTTVVDLILRLFQPQSGTILLDGRDIVKVDLKEWRQKIGYVAQDVFLINDTVGNNIKFYSPGVSQDELVEAAKMAQIYDFIAEQPAGFESPVGERGILLSGGQRQRLALARVLARKPELLVLDEATSALDNASEVAIQKAIASLKGRVTVLLIAHRLSSVLNCDRLIVLEKGKIREQGSPKALLKDKKSYFYKAYNIRE